MHDSTLPQDLRAEEWIKKAIDDELNACSILRHKDGTPSGVAFLVHQMAEKYFKAFLVFRNHRYPRIHPLDALQELCEEFDPSFEGLKRDAAFLNPFYTPARYPGDYPDFSWDEVERAYQAALRIKEFVLARISTHKEKQQLGFTLTGILIALAVIALIGGGGLYLRETQQQKSMQQFGIEKIKEAEALKRKIEQQQKQVQAVLTEITPPAASATTTIDTSNWKTYRNEKYGFEVRYPPHFVIFSATDQVIRKIIPPTVESSIVNITDKEEMLFCCEPLILSIEIHNRTDNLEKFIEDEKVIIPQTEYRISRRGYASFAGERAYRIYSSTGIDSSGNVIALNHGRSTFLITSATLEDQFNEILSTFTFTK